ncbi:NADP-dependent oxidoreductase [Streptomyces luteogriseus]|uniref:NADP-dependent oxidoreductase n=1 Tax=Streptomyces luteogriseus TaxID=68233 RepID=UPI002E3629E1|nr:NADP-dependent oxidoreductase [Streptomyces luteogriseus]WTJ25625.1 NADP-dependent oxidoreductase [Streptomyces luteogriseus]
MSVAITYEKFGGPDVLQFTDTHPPVPGPGQVRIQVRAASVNPMDVKLRNGDLAKVFPAEFPATPGMDAAGVVDALGEGVDHLDIGDDVFGPTATGAYAEHAIMRVAAPKPAEVSLELAAALVTVGEAAWRALAHLDLAEGATLLVHGAAGNVGSLAVQLARGRGINVIGSALAEHQDQVKAHGAQAVTAGTDLVAQVRALAPRGVDGVLDAAGAGVLPESVELTGDPAKVVTLADPRARELGVRFTGMTPQDRMYDCLPQLAERMAAGELTLPIWRVLPLAQVGEAHLAIEERRAEGKIILIP